MLVAMAFCCIAAWLFSLICNRPLDPIVGLGVAYAAGTFAGIGIGFIIRKPDLGAICGGILALLAVFIYVVWAISKEIYLGG